MRAPVLGPVLGWILSAATSPVAADLVLSLPVDCALGQDCFIQQYVDRDPGPGARDFTCAALSYDGHKGTDFRLPDFADIAGGTDVLAAAPGVVTSLRDGMIDAPLTPEKRAAEADRECGNGAVITHGDGWETQYCHLRQGSVTVRVGDRVARGTVLGQIGQSGLAAFPHLHLSVRKDGAVVDPFDPGAQAICNTGATPMWDQDLRYQDGGLLSVGFLDRVPEFEQVRAGTADTTTLPARAEALVLWGFVFGTQPGDTLQITITAPDGTPFHQSSQAFERGQAEAFRASGRRLRDAAPGLYLGRVELRRGTRLIGQANTQVRLGG